MWLSLKTSIFEPVGITFAIVVACGLLMSAPSQNLKLPYLLLI